MVYTAVEYEFKSHKLYRISKQEINTENKSSTRETWVSSAEANAKPICRNTSAITPNKDDLAIWEKHGSHKKVIYQEGVTRHSQLRISTPEKWHNITVVVISADTKYFQPFASRTYKVAPLGQPASNMCHFQCETLFSLWYDNWRCSRWWLISQSGSLSDYNEQRLSNDLQRTCSINKTCTWVVVNHWDFLVCCYCRIT